MCGLIPLIPLYEYQVGASATSNSGFLAGSLSLARDNLATSWKQDVEVLFANQLGSSSYALTAAASVKKNIDYHWLDHLSVGPRAHVSYLGNTTGPMPVEMGLTAAGEYSHFTKALDHLAVISVVAGPGYAYNFSTHEGYPNLHLGIKVGWVTGQFHL